MYFETHAHYNDGRFKNDLEEVIKNLKENKVTYVLNASANMRSSKSSLEFTKKYDFFYCGVGVHPHDVKKMAEPDINILKNYCKNKKVVAIGEIGLDFYYNHSDKETQIYWFKKQLELANDVNLPVIIHSRDASQNCFDIIKSANINKKGVIHCYSDSYELAKEYVKMGYYLGIGGVVTFANAKTLIEVVQKIPIEHLVIETDCPYLSPIPNRGSRNDSTNLKYIVDKIAQIKNLTHDEVAKITMDNARLLFLN